MNIAGSCVCLCVCRMIFIWWKMESKHLSELLCSIHYAMGTIIIVLHVCATRTLLLWLFSFVHSAAAAGAAAAVCLCCRLEVAPDALFSARSPQTFFRVSVRSFNALDTLCKLPVVLCVRAICRERISQHNLASAQPFNFGSNGQSPVMIGLANVKIIFAPNAIGTNSSTACVTME